MDYEVTDLCQELALGKLLLASPDHCQRKLLLGRSEESSVLLQVYHERSQN